MDIQSVGVIGSGIMGSQIGQVLAASGCTLWLNDTREDALTHARHEIEHGRFGLRAAVSRRKLTGDEANAALAQINTTTDVEEACASADLVIEAVPEQLELKLRIFRLLDGLARPEAILASNTAGLPITALAHATSRPERVLGWHWASPCAVMRLAEIIRHPETAQEVVDAVVALAVRCGKDPQVIKDQPFKWGFVANRIMLEARREAFRIVNEGVATPEQVDAIMKDCFRWPVGPFEGMGGVDGLKHRPEADLLS